MDVTADTYDSAVIERSREMPVVVYFWAEWYGPCHVLRPTIEAEVARRQGEIALAVVDVDAEQALAAQCRIQSIPTVVVFFDGVLVTGFMGPQPATFIGSFLDDVIAASDEGAASGG